MAALISSFSGDAVLPSLFIHNWHVLGSTVLAADKLGDLIHLSLFFPVGGLLCLTLLARSSM